jgi:TrpR family transcriptional regulator, trp operon repressor
MSSNKRLQDLYELFASIKNKKEAEQLLKDMLTPKEIQTVAKRWWELQELAKGESQREIAKKLKISISKVTRGSQVLKEGSGGAWLFLKRLKGIGRRAK